MHRLFIIVLTCTILQSPVANAEPGTKTENHRVAGAGMGALIGGILGGPPGAIIGAAGGVAYGNHSGKKEEKLARVETRLQEKTIELARLQEEYNQAELKHRQHLHTVAAEKRRQTLQRLSDGIAFAVYFRTDQSGLEPQLVQPVRDIADLVRDMPSINFQLEAHADQRGRQQYNRALSRERAESVKRVLLESGIPATRIIINALGEERARAGAGDREGYPFDRRVDVKLTLDTRV